MPWAIWVKLPVLKDLPPDKKIIAWIKEAMKLNDDNVKLPERKKSHQKKKLTFRTISKSFG